MDLVPIPGDADAGTRIAAAGRGRAAIESVFKFTNRPGHTLEFQSAELDVQGSTAIEIGAYVRRLKDGSTFSRGRYIVIWKRTGGEWKIHRDMYTSQPRLDTGRPA